jgi:hypothetical protein
VIGVRGQLRRNLVLAIVDVGDEQDRLGGQERQLPHGRGRLRRSRRGAGRASGSQRLGHLLQPTLLISRLAHSAPRLAGDPLQPPLDLLEVRVDELGLDGGDVGERVHATLRMHDAFVGVAAHDVRDRVGFANVAQEPVAESLAAMGVGHQPGDVVELDRVGRHLGGAHHLSHPVEPWVGDRHHRHVGLDGGERVVGGLGGASGEGVEQRRLAGVGQTDDADPHRPRPPTARPSATPASESDG